MAEFVEQLRRLKVWCGNPSVRELARRIGDERAARARRARIPAEPAPTSSTVGHCFQARRRRLDLDLLAELLRALGLDGADRAAWLTVARSVHARQASRETAPPPDVTFDDTVPGDLVRDSVVADVVARRRAILVGLAGVGKSTVARAAAVRLARPDSVVVTIDASAASADVAHPAEAALLRELVRALSTRFGGDPVRLGRTQAQLQDQLRGLLARHPAVLVVDSVERSEQVRWTSSVPADVPVLLTSRHRLRPPGFAVVYLRPLPEADSERLLRALIRPAAPTDGDEVRSLAALSGGLPLTLRGIAASIAQHPDWSLTDNLARVRAEPGLTGIDDALGRSYERWAPANRELFLLLAGWPTRAVPAPVVGIVSEQVGAAVDTLSFDSVVEPDADGGVGMHDLVRAFGARRAASDLRASRRAQVWTAVAGWFVEQLQALMAADAGRGDDPYPRWVELRTQLPAFALALKTHELTAPLSELAGAMTPVADRFGDYDLALQVVDAAVDGADPAVLPGLYSARAQLYRRLGRLASARRAARLGLDALPPGPGAARGDLELLAAIIEIADLRYGAARALLDRAEATFASTGQASGQARAIMALGIVLNLTGRPDAAVATFTRALQVVGPDDDPRMYATLLGNLGEIHLNRGDHHAASEALAEAVRLKRAHGARHDEGGLRVALALALAHAGDRDAALAELTAARDLAAALADRLLESTVECRSGDVHRVLGDADSSRRSYARALDIADEIDADYCRIRAREGLAMLALDRGDPDACDQLRSVLDSFRAAGAGDAARVEKVLASRSA